MKDVFEITHEDILRLTDIQLHKLLKKLLFLETEKNEILERTISVSLSIKQKDGGEDGRIKWDHPVISRTEFFPGKSLLFQCKQRRDSSGFPASACESELINKDDTDKENPIFSVKERIHALFEESGIYILFCNFSCNQKMIDERIAGFRKGLQSANVPYADSCNILIYDGEKIADWTNKFLAATVFVCECVGRGVPLSAQNWEDWAKYRKNQNTFFSDEGIDKKIEAIKRYFIGKQKVARIIGHSGLGKTRLALEAFRPPDDTGPDIRQEDIIQLRLSEKIIYIKDGNETGLVSIVKQWRRSGFSGILIVDECDCNIHEKLSEEIKHLNSNLSLLSIDYSDDCGIREDPIIKLEPVSDSIIKKIISEKFSKLPESDIDRIVTISQGYPQMAVLIAEDRMLGSDTVGMINKKEIVDRLIGGRAVPTESVRKVITACSLFTSFRVKGEEPTHVEFIARKICNLEPAEVIRIIKEIKTEREIIQERGRYFRVTPKPLAITLATEWWRYCSQEEAEQLLLGEEIPHDLVSPLCDQFKYLNLEPQIEELSKELCKERRPFGQAEILNSERGSRIFRSIAEVNPVAATDALYRCFGRLNKEDLRKIVDSRRNLVWALENLCFWENTFPKAANLLLKFAVSETEPGLGNNSTGQFYQLFHYLLSGTQAPPNMRLAVIDEGLSTNDPEFQTICINALGHALQTHHFSRIGGVETQGSRYPGKDWQPKTWKEAFDYWTRALTRLKKYAVNDDALGALARSQIEQSINGMLWYGRLDLIEDVIFSVCKKRGYFWPQVLYILKRFVNLHSKDIPSEGKDRINGWIKNLEPKNIRDVTYVTIIHPERFATFEGKNFIEESNKKVEEFTKKLIDNPKELDIVLELLSKTRSTHGHLFGYLLGNRITDKEAFLDKLIALLKDVPKDQMDESVLGGVLFALRSENSELVSETLEKISQDTSIQHLLLSLTSRSRPNKRDLDRLISQLSKGIIIIQDFQILQYGSVLSHLSEDATIPFLNELLLKSKDGCSVVFELAYMYTFNDEEKFQRCIPFYKTLLIEKKCFINILKSSKYNDHCLYSLNEVSCKLLQQTEPDTIFSGQITNEIIELCLVSRGSFGIYSDFHDLITLLVSPKYIGTTWPIIGDAIISKDYWIYYCLKDIIGGQASCGKWNSCILDEIPLPLISRWCEENSEKAPVFLAVSILPLIEIDKKIMWSPLAKFLLNNYSQNENVLIGLTHKMHEFSWMGSQIPFYETWLNGMMEIKNHEKQSVRQWAEKNIEYLKRMIQETKIEEEERDLRA